MVDYVIPPGVRIGDASRVRLGAHLAQGTTVMHEGLRELQRRHPGQLDGRGPHLRGRRRRRGLDIGGGASTMGTLSGGGKEIITLGKRCLLGANSGCGIPLGDDCVIEAGLYITAGTKVVALTAPRSRRATWPARATSCSAATAPPAWSRSCRGRATASPSTRRCTRTTEPRSVGGVDEQRWTRTDEYLTRTVADDAADFDFIRPPRARAACRHRRCRPTKGKFLYLLTQIAGPSGAGDRHALPATAPRGWPKPSAATVW